MSRGEAEETRFMTEREYPKKMPFQPGAEPAADMAECFDGEVSHALQSYLRQLGALPRLGQEEQEALGRELLAADLAWRQELYGFGTAVWWHLDFLKDKDPAQIYDCVMPSCLLQEELPARVPPWYAKLKEAETALRRAFEMNDRDNILRRRREVTELLMRYRLFSDLLMECHEKLVIALRIRESGVFQAMAEHSAYSPEEFRDALLRLEAARTRLFDLRQKMVEGNLRLVVRIVNQYSYRRISIPDLIQEGNIGLMRSLEKFDFQLGHKFSTYAGWWIRQSIGRALAEQFRIIRIPVHMIATIAAINRAEQRFILEHDRVPEVEEIAAMLEMPTPRVSAIRKMARQTISLQSPLSVDDSGASLEDVLPDEQAQEPGRELAQETTIRQLQKLLDQLNGREREILIMRFGLMGERVRTLQEISDHFHISRERVRQLELQTLNKLRTPENRRLFGDDRM